jgi:hypothetical protein
LCVRWARPGLQVAQYARVTAPPRADAPAAPLVLGLTDLGAPTHDARQLIAQVRLCCGRTMLLVAQECDECTYRT